MRHFIYVLLAVSLAPGVSVASVSDATSVLVTSIKGDQNGVRFAGLTADGESFSMSSEGVGCYELKHGANLASCLQSCDGRDSFLLRGEPDYTAVAKELSTYRIDGSVQREFVGSVAMTLDREVGTGAVQVTSAGEGRDMLCKASFAAEECLRDLNQRIFTADPLSSYISTLDSLMFADEIKSLEPRLLAKLIRIYIDATEVKTSLDAAGITGFRRQGFFVAKTLMNAPTALCQSLSQAAGLGGPQGALIAALEESQAELTRSLSFVKKLQK